MTYKKTGEDACHKYSSDLYEPDATIALLRIVVHCSESDYDWIQTTMFANFLKDEFYRTGNLTCLMASKQIVDDYWHRQGKTSPVNSYPGSNAATPSDTSAPVYVKGRKRPILTERRKSILIQVDGYIDKGDWVKPANAENIKAMMRNVLDQGDYELSPAYKELSDALWQLLETRRGDSVMITWQNHLGYFRHHNLLGSHLSSARLQEMFFGYKDSYSNIDKGRPDRCNNTDCFGKIIPLLDTFRQLIDRIELE